MKKILFIHLFLFSAACLMFSSDSVAGVLPNDLTNDALPPTLSGSNIVAETNLGPGKPGKKKSNKNKKMSRRKCVYCPPMREFEKGQWEASFSAGLVPTYLADKVKVKMPPMVLGADYRFSEKFSLGANFGSSVSESKPRLVGDGIRATYTNAHFVLGVRPGFHMTSIENWDIYGGFSIGVNYSNIVGNMSLPPAEIKIMESHLGIKQHVFSPSFYGYTGIKYAINPKWLAYSEIGFGISLFSMGMSYLIN